MNSRLEIGITQRNLTAVKVKRSAAVWPVRQQWKGKKKKVLLYSEVHLMGLYLMRLMMERNRPRINLNIQIKYLGCNFLRF